MVTATCLTNAGRSRRCFGSSNPAAAYSWPTWSSIDRLRWTAIPIPGYGWSAWLAPPSRKIFWPCWEMPVLRISGSSGISTISTTQTREVAKSFGARSVEIAARRGGQAPGRLQQWLRRSHPRRWLTALRQQGFLGVTALMLALLTCYGLLVATILLATLGVQLTLDLQLWSGGIGVFTALTVLAVAVGKRRHHRMMPTLIALAGACLVFFALFVSYWFVVELAGFILLIGAVFRDLTLRRRDEARRLGLTRD